MALWDVAICGFAAAAPSKSMMAAVIRFFEVRFNVFLLSVTSSSRGQF